MLRVPGCAFEAAATATTKKKCAGFGHARLCRMLACCRSDDDLIKEAAEGRSAGLALVDATGTRHAQALHECARARGVDVVCLCVFAGVCWSVSEWIDVCGVYVGVDLRMLMCVIICVMTCVWGLVR